MKSVDGLRSPNILNIILADDDKDDCFLFEEAISELPLSANITTVRNGVQLLLLLSKENKKTYDVLFLDLNMPQKNGFTCLQEIKGDIDLKQLSVIILSTSYLEDTVDLLYKNGADFYFRKPSSFSELKNVIQQAILLVKNKSVVQSSREKFIISSKLN